MDDQDTTVVLADDHAVVRKGLRLLLEAEDGLHVLAEAGTVPDAIRMAKAHRPNVLVLDLNMPGGSSLEAIPTILEQTEATAIVVLTMQNDPSFARQALQAGALGFVLKEAADDELLGAIRLAAEGETYLNPRLAASAPAWRRSRTCRSVRPTTCPTESSRCSSSSRSDTRTPRSATSCSSACGRSSRTGRTSSRRPAGRPALNSSATHSSIGSSRSSTPERRQTAVSSASQRSRRSA
jgi:DNA-binding NarL/FixJ family response regulator